MRPASTPRCTAVHPAHLLVELDYQHYFAPVKLMSVEATTHNQTCPSKDVHQAAETPQLAWKRCLQLLREYYFPVWKETSCLQSHRLRHVGLTLRSHARGRRGGRAYAPLRQRRGGGGNESKRSLLCFRQGGAGGQSSCTRPRIRSPGAELGRHYRTTAGEVWRQRGEGFMPRHSAADTCCIGFRVRVGLGWLIGLGACNHLLFELARPRKLINHGSGAVSNLC